MDWSECLHHPGVIFAVSNVSYTPYAIYLECGSVCMEELVLNNKTKVRIVI